MSKLSAVFIALFVAASEACGQWHIVTANTEASAIDGVQHRHVVLQDSENSARATIEVALIAPKSASLRVIDNATGSETLANSMRRRNCLAGVNGGYFDPNFKPIGLLISDSVIISPLTRARLLTGVLCSSDHGIEILRRLA